MATTDITNPVIKCANSRMTHEQRLGRAVKAAYDAEAQRIGVDLSTGRSISFHAADAEGLSGASARDLGIIQMTPSGRGLHWPNLYADLDLPALLDGLLGSKKWLAAELGAGGGRARRRTKATSAKENGKR